MRKISPMHAATFPPGVVAPQPASGMLADGMAKAASLVGERPTPTAARKLLDRARQEHLKAIQRAAQVGMSRTELLTDLDAFACAADQIVAMGDKC